MPSQAIASSSAKCKADRPPGNLVSRQSFTMWDIVCEGAPQEQDGSEAWLQRTRFNGRVHDQWAVYYIWSSPLFSPFLSWWHFFLLWFLEPNWTSWCKTDFRVGLNVWYQGQSNRWGRDLTEKLRRCCQSPDMRGSDVDENYTYHRRDVGRRVSEAVCMDSFSWTPVSLHVVWGDFAQTGAWDVFSKDGEGCLPDRRGDAVAGTYVVPAKAVFELPRVVEGVEPPSCFLNPSNTLSSYVQGGQLYTVYIRFTSLFCSVSDRRKVQPTR